MQTFLQLCQAVYREGGISGQIITTQNQNGEALRVVNWVQMAYREILTSDQLQLAFLRAEVQVPLVVAKGVYTKEDLNLPLLAQWDTRSMRVSINQNKADETFVMHMRWPQFRDFWRFSSRNLTTGRPLNVSVDQNTNLQVAPLPDQAYFLNMQYVMSPPDLVDDTDVPVIPDRWQNVIMWRALRHYGMFEAAPEVVMRADTNYNGLMTRMTLDQTPEIIVGAPLC